MLIASRGLSKSYIIAVYACARCVLYPDTKVLIASGQKSQAALIVTQKIQKELIKLPNLEREIRDIKTTASDAIVYFHNGSTIEVVASTDGSRGYRGNILILEEFRLIKFHILDSVLKPFLNVYRQPPFLKKDEYKHLTEENVEIYISSAWYSNHWMQGAMESTRDLMLKGEEVAIFSLDYLTSLHHNLLSRKRIENIKRDRNFDAINFSIEYENIMYGQSSDALFSLDDVNKNRTLKNVFYPLNNLDYETLKNKKKEPLKDGEIRILGVDVALMGGDQNDISVITCMRLIPNGDSFLRKVVYIETIDGGHSEDQAIRIRQIFEDFQASYVALDCGGNGIN